jgi:hypothetical protein
MLLALALPAAADEVDLQLVLAVDVSGSIDEVEAALQRDGYQKALVHPRVIEAIKSGPTGRIAVTYVEWAGDAFQHTIVEWRVIRDEESARAFVSALAETPIQRERRTSISSAIDYSVARLAASGHVSPRRAIDISGDGYNNIGRDVNAARDEAVRAGITINGLPIMIRTGGFFSIDDLDVYYEDCVIGGTGAFVVVVQSPDKFAEAIRRKLMLEIAGQEPAVIPAAATAVQAGGRIDCLVGERLRRQWLQE